MSPTLKQPCHMKALPPQDRTASPRPRCLPKTALHRCSLLPVPRSAVPFAI
ncbi:hypothetical protein [Moorena sp. SIO4G3]|uniref:hypothetical protein n=1 Tax=Moorena sp. SIO4G3 TaxID=2607821 RepID=UPI0025D66778|nr:hypothetical protein [Moorena sp. SIO4G3]